MEIREFAEQVLFGTTLAEKLRAPPAGLTDDAPGEALAAPPAPGRPPQLRFKPQGGGHGSDVPGFHQLDDERERGRLLHFFANHELLATELMALVLLRFPEAPAAFRRGVLRTLQDEQQHTQLYLDRMRACGIAFGELPVSGYFWRCVAPMEHPIDYVSRLSLTFEQANLDFARHFATGFAGVGDTTTAALLEKIYRDEIGHVAYGLKWFRRWKNPHESDWEAFCRQLKFPLSPQRAKGFAVNTAGRRAAGLDSEFIAELDVFAHSKGRTPTVFVFNPFAEGHIARGRAFTPGQQQRQLAEDLAGLPQFLCRQDDIVLVPRRPAAGFLSTIKAAGFPLPEFVATGDQSKAALAKIAVRKLGRLRPWAWSPDSIELLAPLFPALTGDTRKPEECFSESVAQIYSKAWSANFLRRLLAARPPEPWLCTEAEAGVAATTLAQALAAITEIRMRGHLRVVVKEAFGHAGHNAIRLWEPDVLDRQCRWIENALRGGQTVVVEPWLERVHDFSVQLEMESDGLRLCGFTGLINDRKGQFQANRAAPTHARRLPAEIAAAFREPRDIAGRLVRLFSDIRATLECELRSTGYLGPVGIDAFVYRTAGGEVRLKPVVEINPRHTMGRVTLELMTHVAPGFFGTLRLVNNAALRSAGLPDFPAYAHALQRRHPLQFAGSPKRRLTGGTVCLNDPAGAQAVLATFDVGAHSPVGPDEL